MQKAGGGCDGRRFGNRPPRVGEQNVIEDDGRIGAGERSMQRGVDVRRGAGHQHAQSRDVLQHRLGGVLVLRTAAAARSAVDVEGDRRLDRASGQVAHERRFVDDGGHA